MFIQNLHGDIFVLGDNNEGQLGFKSYIQVNTLTLLTRDNNIKTVSISRNNTILYKNDGSVIGFGANTYGQLGLGHSDLVPHPLILMCDVNIKMIISCMNRTVIYKENGDTLVFGKKYNGGSKIIKNPVLLMNDLDIKNIISGSNHIVFHKNNGDILVCGSNYKGQLGLGHHTESVNVPTLLVNDPNIKNIICGDEYTIILRDNGDIIVFGSNSMGQLGLGDICEIKVPTLLMNDPNIKTISCGSVHTIIYKNNGDVIGFGANRLGQLYPSIKDEIKIPTILMNDPSIKNIICKMNYTIIYKDNGDLLTCGYDGGESLSYRHYQKHNIKTLMQANNIKSINEIEVIRWSIDNFKYLCLNEQKRIEIFYLCLKYIQNLTKVKIPKFVIYEILKFL